MGEKTRMGLAALGAALLLGALGDALLGKEPWGIGFPIWICAFAIAVLLIATVHPSIRSRNRLPLLAPALIFAAAFAWRDSLTLQGADTLAVLVLIALSTRYDSEIRLRAAGMSHYILEILGVGAQAAFCALSLVLSDITWSKIPRSDRAETATRVGRGLLIALPLVLVFGALMISADAVVQHFVERALDWDAEAVLTHLFYFAVFAWLSAGYLHGLIGERDRVFGPSKPVTASYRIEGTVVLAVMVALFAAFVAVQVRYLFGGSIHLSATAGLTYAQYARRGFFELVWIAALTLPVLLLAHSAMVDGAPQGRKPYAFLAGCMIALVFAIIASAMKRMGLYVAAYGLTELRLYTSAFMCWLVLVFAWMAMTVLAGRRERFALGGFIAAFVVLALLNIANPDARIAAVNTTRPDPGKRFDPEYVTALSGDAVPALISALPRLPAAKRGIVAKRLLDRWGGMAHTEWPSFNAGRDRASQAVSSHRADLQSTVDQFVPKVQPSTPVADAQSPGGNQSKRPKGSVPASKPSGQ